MERIVYFLGAGFSAPLGLPVIGNFIDYAKDQHLIEKKGAAAFDEVFASIKRLSQIKNFYNAELDNIEELLSILEVDAFLGKPDLRRTFEEFISSVIHHRTPAIVPFEGRIPENWQDNIFGQHYPHRGYGYFVAAIQQLSFKRQGDNITCDRILNAPVQYDVVTANYDCVLEDVCSYANRVFGVSRPLRFRRSPTEDAQLPALAKLHGSVDGGPIVPPTWSKGAHSQIAPAWELAREVLGRAQHIRFVGYSLPEADSYVRYLLKSAVLESDHLKSISALCLDPKKDVRARFEGFVTHRSFRFQNQDTVSLLHALGGPTEPPTPPWEMLERAHRGLFGMY